MSTQPIKGFPLPDDYPTTRVPNAILGRVLSQVEDHDTFRLILRAIWLLERQRGYPRHISADDLRRDRALAAVISDEDRFKNALSSAIASRVLCEVSIAGNSRLMLSTESAQRASVLSISDSQTDKDGADGWDEPAAPTLPTDAFRAYEENIGALSPMIRENILSALEDFTDEDIAHAVRIAVENESRSWSFVAGVLRRWLRDGVPHERRDGKSAGTTGRERISQAELRKYLDAQRKRNRSGTS